MPVASSTEPGKSGLFSNGLLVSTVVFPVDEPVEDEFCVLLPEPLPELSPVELPITLMPVELPSPDPLPVEPEFVLFGILIDTEPSSPELLLLSLPVNGLRTVGKNG